MDSKLYKLMNWPEIESIVYSECDHPQDILGMHEVNGGFLIQGFFPGKENANVLDLSTDKAYPMELVDESGFFACFVSGKTPFPYEYIVEDEEGELLNVPECYRYIPQFWLNLYDKLCAGTFYDSYKYFGAHVCERKGVLGTEFMTYAPAATRVSVVGDFNNWDGRVNQMCKINDCGIFGLFIPGVSPGALYKFEIKISNGLTFLKRDPFALSLEKGAGDACRIIEDPDFEHVKYKRPGIPEDCCFLSASLEEIVKNNKDIDIAKYLIDVCKKYGYEGILFEDFSFCKGKNVTDYGKLSFFAVCPDIYRLKDLISIIDRLHDAGLRVISVIDASSFVADDCGLRGYDGTRFFEQDDYLVDGKLSFDFEKLFVRNYLISVFDYFARVLNLDGICMDGLDRIMYLDYKRPEGQFRTNLYGGNENPGGFEFIKHLNSILHKKYSNFYSVARDSLASNNLTVSLEEGGLGFDAKIHTVFDKDYFNYMSLNFSDREKHYNELTYSPVYIYCEHFVLSYLCKDYGFGEERLLERFPGNIEKKMAAFRLSLGYLFMHPGKKCLSFYDFIEKKNGELLRELVSFYKSKKPLYMGDDNMDSFKWADAVNSKENIVSFERVFEDESLIVICNFSDKEKNYKLPVKAGAYKEVFSTSSIKFGGTYKISGRVKEAEQKKNDSRKYEIAVKLAPLSMHIYEKIPCQKEGANL